MSDTENDFDSDMMTIESTAKSGIFSFLTHWLMSAKSYDEQRNCLEWTKELCESLEEELDPNKNKPNTNKDVNK